MVLPSFQVERASEANLTEATASVGGDSGPHLLGRGQMEAADQEKAHSW